MSWKRLLRFATPTVLVALTLGASLAYAADNALEGKTPVRILQLTDEAGNPTAAATAALETVPAGNGGASLHYFQRGALSSTGENALDAPHDAAILTQPLEVQDFTVAGLTWTGRADLPEGTSIYMRVRENDDWSPWHEVEAEVASGRDDNVGHPGTEPFITGTADGVQIRVTGNPNNLPPELQLSLIPAQPSGTVALEDRDLETVEAPGTPLIEEDSDADIELSSPEEENSQNSDTPDPTLSHTTALSERLIGRIGSLGTSAAVTSARSIATSIPESLSYGFFSRSQWQADESEMTWPRSEAYAPFVVVHHTAGTNNYTRDQAPGIVRGIYHYHAVTLEWGDIGYNFLVDKWGRAYEGRSGSAAARNGKMVVGGHSYGFNTGTMGISMLGTYSTVAPSEATLDTVGKLAGAHLRAAGVDPMSSGSFTAQGNSGKYTAGQVAYLPRISGHRDNGATECPGNMGYAKLGVIRSIATSGSNSSPAGQWQQLTNSRGGTSWYYVLSTGQKHIGWLLSEGTWFYLGSDGAMATGWQKINNKWYYFNSNGAMATGWQKIDRVWYYLSDDGDMLTGWQKINGTWYYLDSNGSMVTGKRIIDSDLYYFTDSGALAPQGWLKLQNTWYWVSSNGALATGWQKINGTWYYFDSDSTMAVGRRVISGKMYLFTDSGSQASSGWTQANGKWYWVSSNGELVTGWQKINGTWYFFDVDATMVTGPYMVNKTTYLFANSGALSAGWVKYQNAWYFADSNGVVTTGWIKVADYWYYLEPTGIMATGWKSIGGYWFFFDSTGVMATGWKNIGGLWYHFGSNGGMTTGWAKLGTYWYHFGSSGAMTTGWIKLGAYWYYLEPSGAMATGSRVINNTTYYFDENGALVDSGSAAPASGFNPAFLISDAQMFNAHTMSTGAIQQFLSEKGRSCRPASDGTACLKDYRITSSTMKFPYCASYQGTPSESSAEVIYKAAQACGINPQVLLTMLQKEQGLLTASGNSLSQTRYSKAMGYACPDSAPCSSAYASFPLQVYGAASRLVQYGEEPHKFNHAAGRTSWVGYHPNASCGGSRVTMANRATAALYNYTPYQPNAAALRHLSGTGDQCSTYGNRNFWRLFNEWFS
ncbi:N-acetylmuramoyl-L-alanine amidase [Schaalia sp. lx-260]|uniref:N-acetylmuramoyl-L-alanine amidase n=1 Tax=Schaalia sp. lx-260 TaxID=2899082 RepID=UPI0022AC0CB9|nr:N-acetylmuramoyl-L-alanine amidase [Schaalia sp. lx-260]